MMRTNQLLENLVDSITKEFVAEKKWIESYVKILKERAAVEESYARTLEKTITDITKLQRPGVVGDFLECYEHYQSTKIEQSKTLRDSLREDIIGSLVDFVARKEADLSERVKAAKGKDSEIKTLMEKIEKLKAQIENGNKAALNTSQKLTPSDGGGLLVDLQSLEAQKADAEFELKSVIQKYNQSLPEFHELIEKLKGFLKEINIGKVTQLRDSLMKLLVYETSSLRNIQYDIEKIPKRLQIEDVEKKAEDSFISTKLQINFSEIDYEEFMKLLDQKATEFKQREIVYENTKTDAQLTWKNIKSFLTSKNEQNTDEKEIEAQKKINELIAFTGNDLSEVVTLDKEFAGVFKTKGSLKYSVQQFQEQFLDKFDAENCSSALEQRAKNVLAFVLNEAEKAKEWKLAFGLYHSIKKKADQVQEQIYDLKHQQRKLAEQNAPVSQEGGEADQEHSNKEKEVVETLEKVRTVQRLLRELLRGIQEHKIFQNMSFCTIFVAEYINEALANPENAAELRAGGEKKARLLVKVITTHFEEMYGCLRNYNKGLEILKYIAEDFDVSEKELPYLLKWFGDINQRLIQNSSAKENFQTWVSEMEEKIKTMQDSKVGKEKGLIFGNGSRPSHASSELNNSLATISLNSSTM